MEAPVKQGARSPVLWYPKYSAANLLEGACWLLKGECLCVPLDRLMFLDQGDTLKAL